MFSIGKAYGRQKFVDYISGGLCAGLAGRDWDCTVDIVDGVNCWS